MSSMHARGERPGLNVQPGDRILVIANPATRRDARRLVGILAATAPSGIAFDIHITSRAGQAREIAEARLAGAKLLVAIGGDGTVAECAHALIGGHTPLGVMPGGSTNITAREQGVPAAAQAAANLIFGQNRLRRIDAAMCDDRIFLHMAGSGFDARLFANTNPGLKRKVGWLAYLPSAMNALRHRPSRYSITVDGDTFETVSPLVLVANGPSVIHPRLKLYQGIRDDDGLLDVLVMTAIRPTELARTIARLGTLQLSKSPFVLHRQGRTITIDSAEPVPIEVDGDVFGTTPRTFQVLPGALEMIVPAR